MNTADKNTILVVEDNDDVRKLLRIYLELQHYQVVEARNGEEAVNFARESNPDLILMDLNMPKMDGIEAVERIRQNAELKEVPILVNSADGARGIDFYLNINNLGKGYIEYLAKPFNYDELPKSIKKILAMHRSDLRSVA